MTQTRKASSRLLPLQFSGGSTGEEIIQQNKVLLLDSTLREGEQTPGVSFTPDQKLAIAAHLDHLGIDMIELGHPGVSPDVDQAIREIAAAGLRAELLVHCRANSADVDAACRYPVQRVAIFLGTSPLHLQKKLGLTERQAIEKATRAIRAAVDHGKRVRFSAEDAFRSDPGFLVEICGAAVDAGADRIGLPDTLGTATPRATFELFRHVHARLVSAGLDAHCHNDLGLGVANALAAVQGGASCVHVTVNGLGERAGLASLASVAGALKVLHDIDTVCLPELFSLTRMVAAFSGVPVPPLEPFIGANAFSHKAGVHTDGVLKDPACYEPFPPELVGATRRVLLDKMAGKAAVRWHLQRLGVVLNDEELHVVTREVKARAAAMPVDDRALLHMAEHARSSARGGSRDGGS